MRIREEGLLVYGFGEQKTPEAFRKVCHKFLFTEVLRPEPAATPPATPTAIPGATAKRETAPVPMFPPSNTPVAELPVALFRMVLEQSSDDQGWSHLGQFGSILNKHRPDFDSRNFGYKKLSHLVRERADLFAVEERVVASTGSKDIYVRGR